MGLSSSFITNTCSQLNPHLNQKSLLALDYEKVPSPESSQPQTYQQQIYQHCHSKKLYQLLSLSCNKKDSSYVKKALTNLQQIKNTHICNVIYSSVNTNLISSHSDIKIFQQHSSLTLASYLHNKKSSLQQPIKNDSSKDRLVTKQQQQTEKIDDYSNLQIANFLHALTGIASEISSLCLPIGAISPEDILLMQSEDNKPKLSIPFSQLINPTLIDSQKGYFSPQYYSNSQTPPLTQLHLKNWPQMYEKNLIFSLGMVVVHYLLLQSCDDCYNYKSKEFCQSQLEKKLSKLSQHLQNRLQTHLNNQSTNYHLNQSNSFISSFTKHTITHLRSQPDYLNNDEQPFELILYQLVMDMIAVDKQKRMNIKDLKFRTRKLTQKVHLQMMYKSKTIKDNSMMGESLFKKAKKMKPKIRSPTQADENDQSLSISAIRMMKKLSSTNENNTTASILPQAKKKSTIKHLKPKRSSNNETSFCSNISLLSDKQNISQNIPQPSNTKDSVRKLSGYRKVKISEHSFLQGYFLNNKAHGLGKITRKNGQVEQCIFHHNEIIDEIHPIAS